MREVKLSLFYFIGRGNVLPSVRVVLGTAPLDLLLGLWIETRVILD